jgi:voltage-gated sodium channel
MSAAVVNQARSATTKKSSVVEIDSSHVGHDIVPSSSDPSSPSKRSPNSNNSHTKRKCTVELGEDFVWILPGQKEVYHLYTAKLMQNGVVCVIVLNYLVSVIQVEILPEPGSTGHQVFNVFEWTFNIIFLIELFLNMYAFFLRPFWSNNWNIFDFFIVTISWVSMLAEGLPGIAVLRLFRAFRVFRLFKRIPSLRMIITGVLKSLPGMVNAIAVLMLIMGVWSIMGVHFFGEIFPDEFGNFTKGLLTCMQMMTYDSWVSGITRPICLYYGSPWPPFFFVSYAFISAIIMANVLIAILVDKYCEAVMEMNAEDDDVVLPTLYLTSDISERLSETESDLCSKTGEIRDIVDNLLAIGVVATPEQEEEKHNVRYFLPMQERVKIWFDSPTPQVFMAAMIFINFLSAAVEAQLLPLEDDPGHDAFLAIEWIFNVFFLIEILLNMYGNWCFKGKNIIPEFWLNYWNILDFLIVLVSWIMSLSTGGDLAVLRLFRAFRRSIVAFRVVKLLRLHWVKIIVVGVLKSLPGVSNAFVLLGLIMGIWSIMGVEFYKDDFPDEFGNFALAMLTMLQIMSFDSWSSGITRPVLTHPNTEPVKGSFFFILYMFASSIIMTNVVLAILIDKFLAASKDAEAAAKGDSDQQPPPANALVEMLTKFGDEMVLLERGILGPLSDRAGYVSKTLMPDDAQS